LYLFHCERSLLKYVQTRVYLNLYIWTRTHHYANAALGLVIELGIGIHYIFDLVSANLGYGGPWLWRLLATVDRNLTKVGRVLFRSSDQSPLCLSLFVC